MGSCASANNNISKVEPKGEHHTHSKVLTVTVLKNMVPPIIPPGFKPVHSTVSLSPKKLMKA